MSDDQQHHTGPEVITPGKLVLFGSGETSPTGRKVFDQIFKELPPEPRLALLETPAGFELNSAQVIERVAEFFEQRLINYRPRVTVVPARRLGTDFSPQDPVIAAPLLEADLIFMGPGSPTYAVRQLANSLAWEYTLARHRLGATLALASAATLAISSEVIPVYEIYKAGDDLHWKPGLNFFGAYSLPLVFVPHWNNADGGKELDTSRCFLGQSRFVEMLALLPADRTLIGIDEDTACIVDLESATCRVAGRGSVTLIQSGHPDAKTDPYVTDAGLREHALRRGAHVHCYDAGESFPLFGCCPEETHTGIDELLPSAWKAALEARMRLEAARQAFTAKPDEAPEEVRVLLGLRAEARTRRDWAQADLLRRQMAGLGWQVNDTPAGQVLEPIKPL